MPKPLHPRKWQTPGLLTSSQKKKKRDSFLRAPSSVPGTYCVLLTGGEGRLGAAWAILGPSSRTQIPQTPQTMKPAFSFHRLCFFLSVLSSFVYPINNYWAPLTCQMPSEHMNEYGCVPLYMGRWVWSRGEVGSASNSVCSVCVYTSLCTFVSPDLNIPVVVNDYNWLYSFVFSVSFHVNVRVFLCMTQSLRKPPQMYTILYAYVCLSGPVSLCIPVCLHTCISLCAHMYLCDYGCWSSPCYILCVSLYACVSTHLCICVHLKGWRGSLLLCTLCICVYVPSGAVIGTVSYQPSPAQIPVTSMPTCTKWQSRRTLMGGKTLVLQTSPCAQG